ncbi:hypothetical protein FLP41_12300 [Paracoccus marcusii]|uniref:hypothetical protein n=1 Tax=Paracoccus marcusii TaxID=59779 RepID=UPI002ED09401|nr:hypothetical protein FLP41_12300 [Paracoccus marcusii]
MGLSILTVLVILCAYSHLNRGVEFFPRPTPNARRSRSPRTATSPSRRATDWCA